MQVEFGQYVVDLHHQLRSILNQPVRAAAAPAGDGAGNRQYITPLFSRKARSDERSARLRRFCDECRQRQPADDAVARGKVASVGLRSWRILRDDRAACLLDDAHRQSRVLRGIDEIRPAAKHGDGASTSFERRRMRATIYPARQPADDGDALAYQLARQPLRYLPAIGADPPRAHNGDGPLVLRLERASQIEQRWRRSDLA